MGAIVSSRITRLQAVSPRVATASLPASIEIDNQGALATLDTVDTAQIDADAVETAKILNEAVTAGISAYTAGSITVATSPSGDTTIQTVTITSTGCRVRIRGNTQVGVSSAAVQFWNLFLKRDGTLLLNLGMNTQPYAANGHNAIMPLAYEETLAAGTYVYTLSSLVSAGSSPFACSRFLAVEEIKK